MPSFRVNSIPKYLFNPSLLLEVLLSPLSSMKSQSSLTFVKSYYSAKYASTISIYQRSDGKLIKYNQREAKFYV